MERRKKERSGEGRETSFFLHERRIPVGWNGEKRNLSGKRI